MPNDEILKEMPIIIQLEKYYKFCTDDELGTFDYEQFGELTVEYLKNRGFKAFQVVRKGNNAK